MKFATSVGVLAFLVVLPDAYAQSGEDLTIAVITEKTVPEPLGQAIAKAIRSDYNLVSLDRPAITAIRKVAKRWATSQRADAVLHVTSWRQRRRAFLQVSFFDGHRDRVERIITNFRGRFARGQFQLGRRRIKRVAELVATRLRPLASDLKRYLDEKGNRERDRGGARGASVAKIKSTPSPPQYGAEAPHRFTQTRAAVYGGGRNFTYNDFLFGQLREFKLQAAMLVGAEVRLIPFTESRANFLSGLSAEFGFVTSLVVSAGAADIDDASVAVDSQWLEVSFGGSWLFDVEDSLAVGPYVGALFTSYTFSDFPDTNEEDGIAPDQTPDAEYFSGLGGARAAFNIEALEVEVTLAAVLPITYGNFLEDTFPNVSGLGAQARIGLNYAISNSFSIGLDTVVERYGLSFNPDPDSEEVLEAVAGGAIDQYWRAGTYIALSL